MSSDPQIRSAVAVAGLLVVLTVPLMVALGVVRQPHWYPVAELAHTELRLRDVGTRHTPLIGVFSPRIAGFGQTTSHPGPLPLFAMWPTYRLLGATAWAMEAASVLTHVVAIGVTLWIARRRGGMPLVVGCAVLLAVVARAYGASTLTQPWNPNLPLLWWLVFLLAVWSVVAGDLPLLPLAVFAGSYCTQAHVAYAGMTVGLLGLAVAAGVVSAFVRRKHPPPRPAARWLVAAALVAGLAWLPPILDQVISSPGNLSALWDYFRHPNAPAIGLTQGIRVLLVHLNPWRLPARQLVLTMGIGKAAETGVATGSLVPGLALMGSWLISVIVAARLRHRALLSLHLVLAVAMVTAAVSMSHIFGGVQYWLVLYAWTINALTVLAISWTLGALIGPRLALRHRSRATTVGALGAAVAITVSIVLFAIDASRIEPPLPETSEALSALVPKTIAALEHRGRYLVSWNDQTALDLRGWGLFNELDRAGFDVGVPELYRGAATGHRVLAASNATGVVHLENGAAIGSWRSKPNVRQVAYYDPRTPEERREFERLRLLLVRDLQAAGLPQIVRSVDGKDDNDNLVLVGLNPAVPLKLRSTVDHMLHLGLPTAVFVGPAEP